MTFDERASARRPVRSFALRKGRVTQGQSRALTELLPAYRVPTGLGLVDWSAVFGRTGPVAMEIGMGSGEALLGLARRYPHWNWVGVEVYPPGVGKLLLALERDPLSNIRVVPEDAVEFLSERTPSRSLDAVYLFFPDPWPKARHQKRRLVQGPFLDLLAERMGPDADLYLATDWPDYAGWMVDALEHHPQFANVYGPGAYAPRCPDRPLTKFEARGEQRGHPVFDLHYRRAP